MYRNQRLLTGPRRASIMSLYRTRRSTTLNMLITLLLSAAIHCSGETVLVEKAAASPCTLTVSCRRRCGRLRATHRCSSYCGYACVLMLAMSLSGRFTTRRSRCIRLRRTTQSHRGLCRLRRVSLSGCFDRAGWRLQHATGGRCRSTNCTVLHRRPADTWDEQT